MFSDGSFVFGGEEGFCEGSFVVEGDFVGEVVSDSIGFGLTSVLPLG